MNASPKMLGTAILTEVEHLQSCDGSRCTEQHVGYSDDVVN